MVILYLHHHYRAPPRTATTCKPRSHPSPRLRHCHSRRPDCIEPGRNFARPLCETISPPPHHPSSHLTVGVADAQTELSVGDILFAALRNHFTASTSSFVRPPLPKNAAPNLSWDLASPISARARISATSLRSASFCKRAVERQRHSTGTEA